MRRFFISIFYSLIVVTAISSCMSHKTLEIRDERVTLSIKVSLSDRVAVTKAEATDDELMKTLRVILIRDNGAIEHNELITFGTSTEISDIIEMSVVPNEAKRLYLLSNVETLSDLNLSNEAGLESRINSYVVAGDLPLPLPITGVYNITIGNEDMEIAQPLFLTRVANKFTFNVKNSSSSAINLTNVSINKVSDRSYLMPHINQSGWLDIMISENAKDEDRDAENHVWITDYDLPTDAAHLTRSVNPGSSIAKGATLSLDPLYVHESKYIPSGSEQSYVIALTIDGLVHTAKLPILKSLVRNTHVDIEVEYVGANITLVFDVVPFDKINNSLVFE